MSDLPFYIYIVFFVSLITVILFITSAFFFGIGKNRKSRNILMKYFLGLIFLWMFAIWLLTLNSFFLDFSAQPTRVIFITLPPALTIIILFSQRRGRALIKNMPLVSLTYIHLTRIPVELVLWWLSSYGLLPLALTFEGQNFDILAGVSAPFVAIFLIGKHRQQKIGVILWNLAGLILVVNILFQGVRTTPYFWNASISDVPNQAVLYFPFIFLPAIIVPIVIFSHLASIYQLILKKE